MKSKIAFAHSESQPRTKLLTDMQNRFWGEVSLLDNEGEQSDGLFALSIKQRNLASPSLIQLDWRRESGLPFVPYIHPEKEEE